MATLVRQAREAESEAAQDIVIHRPAPTGFVIERGDDASFVVVGRGPERAVALNDLTNPEALEYAQKRLTKLGVDKALVRAGVKQGDLVVVGQMQFRVLRGRRLPERLSGTPRLELPPLSVRRCDNVVGDSDRQDRHFVADRPRRPSRTDAVAKLCDEVAECSRWRP